MKTTMPAPTAVYLASAMLAAVSKDPVTPVITGVNLTRHGKALRATVTDRYRVHEVTLDQAHTVSKKYDESVLVPYQAFVWLVRTLRMVAPRGRAAEATVTIRTQARDERQRVIVSIDNGDGETVSLYTYSIVGNFPPVARLLDQAENADPFEGVFKLNPVYLGKFDALLPERHAGLVFKPTVRTDADGTKHPTRVGTVLASYEGGGIHARALVQPMLSL